MMDRISICEALAKRNEIAPFLKWMVIRDDKWVTYYNIVRKRSRPKRGEAAQTVAKPELTARKLNGYVNKQNCRIWSEANPQVYVETPLHPEKLTVWCALWAGGILLQKR
ncbi:hypothetical protein TNCV_3516241 [Trichonephila clavipes]|nr:hypothetical protein TNCV_3516241 [Trichonephila clavipes]